MPHAVGHVLGGRYEILSVLTPGGQGDVYQVHDRHLNVEAVLKLIDLSRLPGGVWDEAQALNRLADAHILRILNADVIAGQPFIVTELALHGTLDSELVAGGGLGLAVGEVADWTRQACLGVARAHDDLLVHNDIKPANLFLNARRDCLVGDFGLASLRPAAALAGVAKGATPETAAPEVAASWTTGAPPATPETDIYSLGASAFWLLAGRPPVDLAGIRRFDARMAACATQVRPKLRDVAPHVPRDVARAVDRAISRDPRDRFPSAIDFAAALGSRRLEPRRWMRTDEHPNHIACWRGERTARATCIVCVEPGSTARKCEVVGRRSNGSRIHRLGRECALSQWPQSVRAAIASVD